MGDELIKVEPDPWVTVRLEIHRYPDTGTMLLAVQERRLYDSSRHRAHWVPLNHVFRCGPPERALSPVQALRCALEELEALLRA